MSVRNDLERAIAVAESAKGNYLLFAVDSEDDKATQVFKDMAEDMERHVKILESRRDYLDNQGSGGNESGGKQKQKKNQGQNQDQDQAQQ